MTLNSNNNSNTNQELNSENIINLNDDFLCSIKVTEYLKNNSNIEYCNKIVIAKNIALACQRYNQKNIWHGELTLNSFMINPDTLAVSIAMAETINSVQGYFGGYDPKLIESLPYSPPEKSNSSIITETNSYSVTAIIIDMITGISLLDIFQKTIWPQYHHEKLKNTRGFYGRDRESLERIPHHVQFFWRDKAIKQFFGKSEIDITEPRYVKHYTENGITMCSASHVRIVRLKEEINQFKDLQEDAKKALITFCAKGLALDPEQRPTLDEFIEALEDILAEFRMNLQKELRQFIESKIAEINRNFPSFDANTSEKIKALYPMVIMFSKKEKITHECISRFKEIIGNIIKSINSKEIDVYFKRIDKGIVKLENEINKAVKKEQKKGAPSTDQLNVEDVQNIPGLLRGNAAEYVKNADAQSFNEKNNAVLKLLRNTYRGTLFCAHEVFKFEEVVKEQVQFNYLNNTKF